MAEQVIDASVAIKWVVKGEPFRNKARKLLHDARLKGIMLIGPPLLEYDVLVSESRKDEPTVAWEMLKAEFMGEDAASGNV